MQSSDRVLAGRYAAALFQAAAAKSEDQKVQTDLIVAKAGLAGQAAALRHPRVPMTEKKRLIHAALDGKVSATTLSFLDLLIAKKRYELFELIAADYAALAEDKRGVARAQVRTAKALTPDEQNTLAARLKIFAGKDIELEIKEDSELIGGVAVKIGDWVLDSSLRGQLRRMKESFN